MKYKCLIVDDEPIAREVLEKYISEIPSLQLEGMAATAQEAGIILEKKSIDLLFLDIQMPGLSGLDFLQALSQKPITILTTAFRDYALDGFELGVMDYLMKPINQERFNLSVQRAIEFIELKQNDIREMDESPANSKMIVIKSGTKKISLSLNDITHIQGLKDYSIIYAGNKKYLIKGYIKTIVARFHPDHFIRVHKSFIVARNRIHLINKGKIEIEDFQIPVGNFYRREVEDFLENRAK
jgi:DNA-binding LytR/AlgR family response regulator